MEERKRVCRGMTFYEHSAEGRDYYVDKTLMIRDLCASDGETYIISRPRIYGKSLNLDTVRCFFDPARFRPDLFEGRRIASEKGCMAEAGRHPVISIGLFAADQLTWESSLDTVRGRIGDAIGEHPELEKSAAVAEEDREALRRVRRDEAGEEELKDSLRTLIRALHACHGERVVVLVDEYFMPLLGGADRGYLPEASAFMREFLSRGLNDNPDLWFAVLTDVTGVCSSEVNAAIGNLRVCTILDEPFSEYFGFTEEETGELLAYCGLEDKADEVRAWYGGYRFCGREMYNPRSVEDYVDNGCEPKAFWTNVSRNWAMGRLLARPTHETEDRLERLSRGETLSLKVNRGLCYENLSEEDVFTVLLYSGYLTSLGADPEDGTGERHLLKVPNREIARIFEDETLDRIRRRRRANPVPAMWDAIERRDAPEAAECLMDALEWCLEACGGTLNETGILALFFGFLGHIDNLYENGQKERRPDSADMVLLPKDKRSFGFGRRPAMILEFGRMSEKRYSEEGLRELARNARLKIDAGEFDSDVRKKGYGDIVKAGIAICGARAAISI